MLSYHTLRATRDALRDRVVGANILRRMLTVGQRAMIAASLANMTNGGDRKSDQRTNLSADKTNEDAAKTLSVSPMTVKNAKEVKRDAPDLAEKVSRGEMSLNAAKMLWY